MAAREPSRFEESHPLRMFPTFVWRGEVAAQTRDPLNTGIVGALDSMRSALPPSCDLSRLSTGFGHLIVAEKSNGHPCAIFVSSASVGTAVVCL